MDFCVKCCDNLTFCLVSKNLQIKLRHLLTYMDVEQLIRLRINGLICEKVVKMAKIVNFFREIPLSV